MFKKLVLGSLLVAASLAASAEQYLIDVRSPEEFAEAHADGAINIPVDEVSQKISDITQDHDADIYVYCRSGRRAGVAQQVLNGMGYRHVTNLGTLADAEAFVEKIKAADAGR